MKWPDLRPLCLACGNVVAVHSKGDTGDCPACGPVHFTGTLGDIDLTSASLPRFVPDEPPAACFTCGAAITADCFDAAPPGADALCPTCGPVVFVVFHDDRGRPLQGTMTADELPPQHDDGEPFLF